MSCKYCYLNKNRGKFNTFENITKAINLLNPDELFFYGGEPLLAFNLLQKVVRTYPNKFYSVETNAKILNQTHMDYFSKHNFRIYISLDGLDERANSQRQMSQSHIDKILALFKINPNISLVITITNNSINQDKFIDFIKQNAHKANTHPYEIYLAIDENPCNLSDEILSKRKFYTHELNVVRGLKGFAKFRVHIDGTISQNHARSDEIFPKFHQLCKNCEKFEHCVSVANFPQMIYQMAQNGTLKNSFTCKASKIL